MKTGYTVTSMSLDGELLIFPAEELSKHIKSEPSSINEIKKSYKDKLRFKTKGGKAIG